MAFTITNPLLQNKKTNKNYNLQLIETKRKIMDTIKAHIDITITNNTNTNNTTYKNYNEKLKIYCSIEQIDLDTFIDNIRNIIEEECKKHCINTTLQYWNSLIHLHCLSRKEELTVYQKLKKWTNEHFYTDDIKKHAIRGNFESLLSIYPELKDAIDELAILKENEEIKDIETNKIEMTTENLKDSCYQKLKNLVIKNKNPNEDLQKWRTKYDSEFPETLNKIFMGKYNTENEIWADRLLYSILYVPKDIKNILKEDNVYAKIINGNIHDCFDEFDDFMKIICFFLVDHNSQLNLKIISSHLHKVFRKCLNYDLEHSLDCLVFDSNIDLYFNYIINNANLNEKSLKKLIRFAKENNLETNAFISKCNNELQKIKDYGKLFAILKKTHYYSYNFDLSDKSLINFCLKNYEYVKPILQSSNIASDFLDFISFMNNNEDWQLKMINTLQSKYMSIYYKPIINKIITLDLCVEGCELMLLVIMKLEREENILLTQYKKYFLRKLIQNIKKSE